MVLGKYEKGARSTASTRGKSLAWIPLGYLLCSLDAYSDNLYEDCVSFAEAIYVAKEHQTGSSEHFDEMARDFITSFLMFLTVKNSPIPPNPVQLLNGESQRSESANTLAKFADEMAGLKHPDEFIKRSLTLCAGSLLKMTMGGDNGEFRGVLTTVSRAMQAFRGKVLSKSVMASKNESLDLINDLFQNTDGGNHAFINPLPVSCG